MKPRTAIVLGAGPAGLLAAAALLDSDVKVKAILNKGGKSSYAGAQYLHRAIPEVTSDDPDGAVTFIKLGTREGYAQKVYGDPNATVSWDFFSNGPAQAWSMARTYDTLWNRFEDQIHNTQVKSEDLSRLQDQTDMIVSSIPQPQLCIDSEHTFRWQSVNIKPEHKVEAENVIMYSGREDEAWYRTSHVFGRHWTEYPADQAGKHNGLKPISNDCDCHPGVLRIGRFGEWRRDVLSHHAYERVLEEVEWRV